MSRRVFALVCLVILALPVACSKKQPEERLSHPTAERLAVKENAVGVPYGRFMLLKYKEQLIAVNIRSASGLGQKIVYDWYLADVDGRFNPAEALRQGHGETTENPYTGRISIPGGLTLEWSRGSRKSGWLYWPQQGPELEVFSRPFGNLNAIDQRPGGGRWLKAPEAK